MKPPGTVPYTVMVAFRVEAQSAEAAVNAVRAKLPPEASVTSAKKG